MTSSFEDIARRMVNAEDSFCEAVMEETGCDRETAIRIMRFYLKNKLAKVVVAMGRIDVKHGAYWEKDALLRANDIALEEA